MNLFYVYIFVILRRCYTELERCQ